MQMLGYGFVSLLILVFGWKLSPFIDTHPAQDRCGFGHVTNEQYRSMLLDAEKLNLSHALRSEPRDVESLRSDALQSALGERLQVHPDIETEIADMHAILRSIGASYLEGGREVGYFEPVEGGRARVDAVFRYFIPTLKLRNS